MTSTAKSSVRRVLAMLMSVLAVGCGSFWGRDCGEQPDHPSAYPDPEFSDEILEVDHDALEVVRVGPDCERAVVTFTDPLGRFGPRLAFPGLDGRCSARWIRSADASRYVPSQPPGQTDQEVRVAIAFTSMEAMNAWTPFTDCREIDASALGTLVDDWAISQLGPRLEPRQPEPDRACYCPREHYEDRAELVLYYDADLVAVAVQTHQVVTRMTAPPHLTPAWAD